MSVSPMPSYVREYLMKHRAHELHLPEELVSKEELDLLRDFAKKGLGEWMASNFDSAEERKKYSEEVWKFMLGQNYDPRILWQWGHLKREPCQFDLFPRWL